jgi:hypothetical protein
MQKNESYEPYRLNLHLDHDKLPIPIFDENPSFLELYWKSWELAWDHVVYREDSPQKLYIDESMTPKTIWIWDTLFMSLFCKYSFKEFPGIESLNNFYFIIHDKKQHPVRVQHPDNPPFFGWVEYEYAKMTGDLDRLKWLVQEKKYLQKHFEFIENGRRFKFIPGCSIPMMVKKLKSGYLWSGTPSGMDNTPRARGKYWRIFWIDLISQQALSAKYISLIASLLHDTSLEREYYKKYLVLKDIINGAYWDDKTGFYYDLNRFNRKKLVKIMTPASFWAMLAEIPGDDQGEKMLHHIRNPSSLGGYLAFPSVARSDRDFDPGGQYWRGGVWVPICYMGVKALEKYDELELARKVSMKLLRVMYQTYKEFSPHTIWEAYSPTEPKPCTYKKNLRYVRPNFCGWSALAPISMFIENVIGFHTIDAFKKQIHWNLDTKYSGKQGILNLRFGDTKTDILYENNQIGVKSDHKYSLIVNNTQIFDVELGRNTFFLD